MKKYSNIFMQYYSGYVEKYYKNTDEENKQKIAAYFYLTLSLFTASFFGLFAIRPTLTTISNLNRQLEDSREVKEKLDRKYIALQKLDSQYSTIQQDLNLVYTAIPEKNNMPQLSRQIETLAREHNLTLSKLNFGTIEAYPNEKTTTLYSFTITATLEGTEPDINTFIADFIRYERIVDVDRIITGKTSKNSFGLSISGRAFFSGK